MQKQWTEMTQDEKLEYLRDRVQKTDATPPALLKLPHISRRWRLG